MPAIHVDGVELHYTSTGSGRETVVLSHGLLLSSEMFREQVRHLSDRYRVVTYDHRGQGRSEVTAGGYDMDGLARDAAALVEALGIAPCHFAGVSMGGFVGMRLAARRPDLLRSCILIETGAEPETPENVSRYGWMNLAVRLVGARPLVPRIAAILFGRSFLSDPDRAVLRREWMHRLGSLRRSIHRAVNGVVTREGVVPELGKIAVPTLVVVGDEDVATPPEMAERLARAIPGARKVVIPRAGHSSPIENPEAVNAALDAFLGEAVG